MPIYGEIVIGCWLIFTGFWLVASLKAKATAERKSFASSLSYRLPVIIGGILLGTFHWGYPMNLKLTPDTIYTRWAGAFVCVAGLAITIWARCTIGGNWSSTVEFKEGHQLIRKGPYRFVRHPIYTGILVMCAAHGIQFGRLHCWLALILIGVGLWIKLRQEESVMLQHFPEYSKYRKEVKALVPFVV